LSDEKAKQESKKIDPFASVMLSNLTSLANKNKNKDVPKDDDGFGEFSDFKGINQEDNKAGNDDGFGDFGDFEDNNTQPTPSQTTTSFPK
jgi:hypothetical protein